MSLSIGIVGLPNVGKSTLFNALTRAQNAQAANYPFCTIEPNKATVAVPDGRVDALSRKCSPKRTIHATVDFTDIAGLVRGASTGEGLGNRFLANIRECAAILHVARCFEDGGVTHVETTVDPLRDVEIVETELLLADLQTLDGRLERQRKMAKGVKDAARVVSQLEALRERLDGGEPAAGFPMPEDEGFLTAWREMGLLTAKPVVLCANVQDMTADAGRVAALRDLAKARGAGFACVCAKLEEELQGLPESEQASFLEEYGVRESGLDTIVRVGYEVLGLCSFFTAGPDEVRAWTIRRGWKAPKAAGTIHTDFEKGFIRAEVVSYDAYMARDGEAACRADGVLRIEGKDYVVQDGDVMHFLFNV
jgi:GTP-binding protein YchF